MDHKGGRERRWIMEPVSIVHGAHGCGPEHERPARFTSVPQGCPGAFLRHGRDDHSLFQPYLLSDPADIRISSGPKVAALVPAGRVLSCGVGYRPFGWASNYPTVLLLVILSGLGVAVYHPEGWRIANAFAGEKKATGMSIFAVGGNLGFAFGPPLGIFFVVHFGLKGSAIFIVPASSWPPSLSSAASGESGARPSLLRLKPRSLLGFNPPGPLSHGAPSGDDHVPLLDPDRGDHLHPFLLHQHPEGRSHEGGNPPFSPFLAAGRCGDPRGRAFRRSLRP